MNQFPKGSYISWKPYTEIFAKNPQIKRLWNQFMYQNSCSCTLTSSSYSFKYLSSILAWVRKFLMKDYQAFPCGLYFLSHHLWLPPSMFSLVVLWRKVPLALKVLHLLDQELRTAEILSLHLILNIHLTILGSFLSSVITSSSLSGQVSLPYSTTLRTHAEYNLPFATQGKPLLANKGS